MHWAASKGHAETIKRLIRQIGKGEQQGGDEDAGGVGGGEEDTPYVDFQDGLLGWTALHLACVELHLDAVKELLRGGADPGVRDDVGDRPLDTWISMP